MIKEKFFIKFKLMINDTTNNYFTKFKLKSTVSVNLLHHYCKIGWLPLVLIIIFVVQNHLFDLWLHIPIRPYFIRRTVVTAAFGSFLFLPALLTNKHVKYFYLILASIFTSIIFIIQFIFYSYSGGFLQASALFYAGEGLTILSTVKTLLTYHLFFFLFGPLSVIGGWILIHQKIITEKMLIKKEKAITAFLIILFVASGYGYLFLREKLEAGNVTHIYQYNKLYDVNALVSKMGIINFSLGDILSLGIRPDGVTAAEVSFVKTYTEQRPTSTLNQDFGLLKGRNLIFIQVESLENAVINQKINGQEITPNLNKLAKTGIYFSNYYAPIGPGTTADAEFMTLNSLYSLPNTVAFIEYSNNHYSALPNLLKENGYHTYAMHGDVSSFWNRSNIYPNLGYEKWFSKPDYTIPRKIGVYNLGDKDFFDQSILKLKSLPQPFMATLITLTSHTPFEMPLDLQYLDIPTTTTSLTTLQRNYLQSVRYTDQAIGDFIEQLKTNNLYNNSLIFIYGDHGSFSKISNALGVKDEFFADLQTSKVPMILLAPGTSLKGEKRTPTSHMDVYPTASNLLGFTPPPNIFGHYMIDGKNAVTISRNLVSGTITSIITNKLAYHATSDGTFEHGRCLQLPDKKRIAIDFCRQLYNEEESNVRASDLLVKGDLIKR